MAAQFDSERVILQPTPQEAPAATNVFEQGASVFGQQASQQASQGQASVGYGLGLLQRGLTTVSSAFDKALDTYSRYAEQKADEDAPAAIKRDGEGNIIPPSSFYPPGINTRVYAERYANTSMALYKSYAEQELIQHSALMREKYPTDPAAYAEQMKIKRQAMQTNLDPRVAPWIDIRAEQIQAQGTTQIAVANQSAKNAVTKEQYERSLQGISDDAGRVAANTPQGQGGGGSQVGLDNNVGNITSSGDNYHGGKSLPYKAESGLTFETFQSAEHGVAAAYNLIRRRVREAGGIMSFTDLVNVWDPKAAPDVKANYAAAMAKAAGLAPGDAIPVDSAAGMAQVIKAQNQFEKGKQTVSDAALENGIKLANGDKNIPLTNQTTAQVVIADPKQLSQLADQAIQTATIAQRISDLRALAQSGARDPALVERDIAELKFTVQMKAMGEQIRNSPQALYVDGVINPGAVAAAEERIREIAASPQYAGREQQVIDKLMGDLNYAKNQASQRAGQVQVNDQRAAEPRIRQMMADQAAAKLAALNGDSVTANAITKNLEQQSRNYLNDASISDSVAMKLATASFSAGSVSRSALQEANTNRLQGLSAVVHDPQASPEQKAAAYESAKAVRNDPEVYRELTAGQRSYLQGTMDDHVKLQYAGQIASFHLDGLKGLVSPPRIDEIRREQAAKGMITPDKVAEYAIMDERMKAAYHAAGTQSRLAGEHLENFQKGRTSTDTQLDAAKKEIGWRPPGGAPSFDFNNPEHLKSANEHYRKYGFLPDQVKASLDKMQHSPDEAVIAGPKALFQTIQQVERLQMEKVHGKGYDEDREKLLTGKVAAIVGENYSFLAMATKYNANDAAQVSLAKSQETSKAGNLGQTADQTNNGMNRAVDTLAGTLQKSTQNIVSQILSDPLAFLREDANLSPTEKAIRDATGVTPGGDVAGYLKGYVGLGGRGNFEKVEFDSNFRTALTERATIHNAHDGKAIKTGLGSNGSVEEFVVTTAFFTAVRNGEVSATVSEDGKTVRYGWKTLGDHVAQGIGIPVNKTMERGFAAGLVSAENMRLGRDLAEVDPARTYVSTYQADNGQMRYRIAQQDRNGNFVQLEDMAKDDPRITLQALGVVKAATQAVVANAAPPGVYGTALLPLVTGPLAAGAIASEFTGGIPLKWPVDGYVKAGSLIGGAVQQMQIALNRPEVMQAILGDRKLMTPDQLEARKNAQVYTQKLLQDLDSELKKIPDAPNAKAALSHMIDNHAPGTDGTALQRMIKDSGYYQPGRLSPVRTEPSRIGTEKP